jgi:hypothetical protein
MRESIISLEEETIQHELKEEHYILSLWLCDVHFWMDEVFICHEKLEKVKYKTLKKQNQLEFYKKKIIDVDYNMLVQLQQELLDYEHYLFTLMNANKEMAKNDYQSRFNDLEIKIETTKNQIKETKRLITDFL